MAEIIKSRVEAYLAFLKIYKKWESSAYPFDKEFLEQVIHIQAPLDYMDTHYNLIKEINAYELPSAGIFMFNTDQSFKNELEISNYHVLTGGETLNLSYPAPVTFIGDVHVKGNLEVAFDNRVFITGDLIVDRVLTCRRDTVLMVGGAIKAKGIHVETGLSILSICAERIEVSDLLHWEHFIYAGEIRSKLILAEVTKLAIQYYGYENTFKSLVPTITFSTIFGLPMADLATIRSLCNPVIFGDPVSEPTTLDDLLFDLFYCLENEITVVNEDYSVTIVDSIF